MMSMEGYFATLKYTGHPWLPAERTEFSNLIIKYLDKIRKYLDKIRIYLDQFRK